MSEVSEELVRQRRALVSRRRDLKSELTRLQRTITALETVLALVEPGYGPEAGHANRRGGPPSAATMHVISRAG